MNIHSRFAMLNTSDSICVSVATLLVVMMEAALVTPPVVPIEKPTNMIKEFVIRNCITI